MKTKQAHTPGPLPLIMGAECPSCGRDNKDYQEICTSDDCPGVQKYAATPDLLDALKTFLSVELPSILTDEEYEHIGIARSEARAAIAKAEGK